MLIRKSRYLTDDLKAVVDTVIQRNAYWWDENCSFFQIP